MADEQQPNLLAGHPPAGEQFCFVFYFQPGAVFIAH